MSFDEKRGSFEAPFFLYLLDCLGLRGKDLNLRPLGYEFDKLIGRLCLSVI
jgi:hypothetical protein